MNILQKEGTDAELVEGIRAGGHRGRLCENRLYETFGYFVRKGARKYPLTDDETSMAYSDAVLAVIEHIASGRFEGRSGLKTYLYQLFSNKCVDLVRKKTTKKAEVHRTDGIEDYLYQLPDDARTAVQNLMQQQDAQLLGRRLRELGEKCQRMVWAWGQGRSDGEVAREMGYQSAAVVKTSRLRCMQKLRALYLGEDQQ